MRSFGPRLPAFVAEIKTIFEPWQLAEYLEKAGWTEPFDPSLYDEDDEDSDPEFIEMERKDNLRRAANELLLIERAKEWLLGEETTNEEARLLGATTIRESQYGRDLTRLEDTCGTTCRSSPRSGRRWGWASREHDPRTSRRQLRPDRRPVARCLDLRVRPDRAGRRLREAQGRGPGRGVRDGPLLGLLARHGFRTDGLDASPAMIALARDRHPEARLFHADICRWELPRSYDLIVAWDSVWHVPLAQQEAVLTKLCRGLSAGGVLVFTTGGTDAPSEKQDSCMGPPMYHATLGIPKTLQVLAEAGCVCRHLEYDQHPEAPRLPHRSEVGERRPDDERPRSAPPGRAGRPAPDVRHATRPGVEPHGGHDPPDAGRRSTRTGPKSLDDPSVHGQGDPRRRGDGRVHLLLPDGRSGSRRVLDRPGVLGQGDRQPGRCNCCCWKSPTRPLVATVATSNGASLRVLQKCGFVVERVRLSPASDRYPECEEAVLVLTEGASGDGRDDEEGQR